MGLEEQSCWLFMAGLVVASGLGLAAKGLLGMAIGTGVYFALYAVAYSAMADVCIEAARLRAQAEALQERLGKGEGK